MSAQTKPNAYESEIDTKLADLYGQQDVARINFERTAQSAKNQAGATYYYKGKQRVTDMTLEEAEKTLAADIKANLDDTYGYTQLRKGYNVRQARETVAKLAEIRVELALLQDEIEAQNALYTGWTRFFIVNNLGGHIHDSMSCHSCRPTTKFGWLPDMSGLTEKDAVAAHGPHLCSFCFPSAPVEWTQGIGEAEREAKKATQCAGSGTYDHDSSGLQYYSPRARCNHCHETTSVTSTGKLRGHKPQEA